MRPLLPLLAMLLVTVPANAGEAKPQAQQLAVGGGPVTVTSDEMAYLGGERKITFSGNVRVVREGSTMTSRTLVVTLGEGAGGDSEIRSMEADGDVVFDYGTRHATAGHAVYDPAAETVVLTQNPAVQDADMRVVGARIVVNLVTQQSTVESGTLTFTGTRR